MSQIYVPLQVFQMLQFFLSSSSISSLKVKYFGQTSYKHLTIKPDILQVIFDKILSNAKQETRESDLFKGIFHETT